MECVLIRAEPLQFWKLQNSDSNVDKMYELPLEHKDRPDPQKL